MSEYGVQLELSRAWLVQFAQHLVFPDHSRRCHADGRFVLACLSAVRRLARGHAVRDYVPVHGRDSSQARLSSGARTHRPCLADFANARDLPSDAQLLHLESDPTGDQRRVGELGKLERTASVSVRV